MMCLTDELHTLTVRKLDLLSLLAHRVENISTKHFWTYEQEVFYFLIFFLSV